ncbi:MAG: hypothetical protein ORN27_04460 [Rhodoluna sp.]|nr:hypothetical protein [Rhodoluna sp.]
MKFDNPATIFKKVISRGTILIAGIAAIGGLVGSLVAGMPGLFSALIGAAMTLLFVTLTAATVWLGAKLSVGGFFGVVMGTWLLKLVLFIVLVKLLLGVKEINGPVLFFTLIASILGSLVVDALVVTKARMPIVEN